MYARPLFVVVGIFGAVLVFFDALLRNCALASPWLPLGFPRRYRIYAGRMNEAITESPPRAVATLQLSIVVPPFNERDNVTTLFRRLETAIAGFTWEVLFVDVNYSALS